MIVKTIDADHQLESRKSDSPAVTATRATSITEKSYLRSQFERRQKRQIELTNKMNQQEYQQQQQQPDSVIRSHELIKRRFFEELERRESISAARGNNGGAIKPGEFEQVGSGALSHRHDHQRQPSQWPFELAPTGTSGGLDDNITETMLVAKVGAVSESDGAAALTGTDEVDGASLETIITKSSSSAAASIYEVAAKALCRQLPPLVDAKIDDSHRQRRQVDAASGLLLARQEAEATKPGARQQRRASNSADLQKREPLSAGHANGNRCVDEQHVEKLRGRVVGRQQYANPRSCSRAATIADSSRGSHDDEDEQHQHEEFSDRRPMGNNANHDQPDGSREDLICAPLSCGGGVAGSGSQVVITGGMRRSGNAERERLSVMGMKELGSASEPDQSIESLQHDDQETSDMARPNDGKAQGGALDAEGQDEERVVVADCDRSSQKASRKKQQRQQATQSTSPGGEHAERILEEDVGSSCSSSGFGASVSAGSSSSCSTSSTNESSSHRRFHQRRNNNSTNQQDGHEEEGEDCVREQLSNDHYRRPSSLRYEPLIGLSGQSAPSNTAQEMNQEEIAQFEIVVGRAPAADAPERSPQSLSVEGAYQPMLHVENHGYGSLANACQTASATQTARNHRADKRRWPLVDAGKVSSELDLYSNRQYVNLPTADSEPATQSSPLVSLATAAAVAAAASVSASADSTGAAGGYAAVRAKSVCAQDSRGRSAGSANIPTTGQNNGHSAATVFVNHERRLQPAKVDDDDFAHSKAARAASESRAEEDRESNLSEHNSTTSSANTGGFSKLPPVRLIDHHFANGLQSSKAPLGREPAQAVAPLQMTGSNCAAMQRQEESNSMRQSKKSPSLLKRFGSLVSRAFTTSNSATSGCGDVVVVDGDRCNASNPSGGHYGSRSHAATSVCALLPESNYAPASESRLAIQAKRPNTLELETGISDSPGGHKSIENATGVFRAPTRLVAASVRASPLANSSLRASDWRQSPVDSLVKQQQTVSGGSKQRHMAMAQADLIILSTKNSRANNQAITMMEMRDRNGVAAFNNDNCTDAKDARHCGRRTRTSDNNNNAGTRCNHRQTIKDGNRRRFSSAHRMGRRFRRSLSSTRSSSVTSLSDSSLYSSSQDLTTERAAKSSRKQPMRRLQRTSSLSEELESLMSRSEAASNHLYAPKRCDKTQEQATRRHSLAAAQDNTIRVDREPLLEAGAERSCPSVEKSNSSKPQRSLMRWFNASGGSACSSPAPKNDCKSIQYDPNGWTSNADGTRARALSKRYSREKSRPKSPIDRSHANGPSELKLNRSAGLRASTRRLHRGLGKQEPLAGAAYLSGEAQQQQQQQPSSLIYTSLQHQSNSHDELSKRQNCYGKTSSSLDDNDDAVKVENGNDELIVSDGGKCQSLNLYQNLLRNYVKRRRDHSHNHHHHHHHHHRSHHRSHHHHHSHHNHHHHGQHHGKHSNSARHAHSSTGPRCGQPDSPMEASACPCACSTSGGKWSQNDRPMARMVWGQLIEINKSDGSQVIELERAPGRSWGFFVARGAINNKKGIFISRMHDNMTGSPLGGLLSIGDQIISIDGNIIEPDFDILRVNQIISKKSKILLGVKPFKD